MRKWNFLLLLNFRVFWNNFVWYFKIFGVSHRGKRYKYSCIIVQQSSFPMFSRLHDTRGAWHYYFFLKAKSAFFMDIFIGIFYNWWVPVSLKNLSSNQEIYFSTIVAWFLNSKLHNIYAVHVVVGQELKEFLQRHNKWKRGLRNVHSLIVFKNRDTKINL